MTPFQRAGLGSQIVTTTIPGAIVTSGYRSPAKNAAVGGVYNSTHLDGLGIDFVPPKGVTNQQAINLLQVSGAPIGEIINEGDHVHVGFTSALDKGQGLLESSRQKLVDISNGLFSATNRAIDIFNDPVGEALNAAAKPLEDYVKRIGVGLLGFTMVAAVIFYATKVDPVKFVTSKIRG